MCYSGKIVSIHLGKIGRSWPNTNIKTKFNEEKSKRTLYNAMCCVLEILIKPDTLEALTQRCNLPNNLKALCTHWRAQTHTHTCKHTETHMETHTQQHTQTHPHTHKLLQIYKNALLGRDPDAYEVLVASIFIISIFIIVNS